MFATDVHAVLMKAGEFGKFMVCSHPLCVNVAALDPAECGQ